MVWSDDMEERTEYYVLKRKVKDMKRIITGITIAIITLGCFSTMAFAGKAADPVAEEAAESGWKENQYGKWYLYPDGSWPVSKWELIDRDWYYFNDCGYMAADWIFYKDNWYYLDTDGRMAAGWVFYKDDWYYLNTDGRMATGWVWDNGFWYYLKENGTMAKDYWLDYHSKRYYFGSDGIMKTGWYYDGKDLYHFDDEGAATRGWIEYGDNWCFMDNTGKMISNVPKNTDGTEYEFDENIRVYDAVSYDGITLTEDIAQYMKELVNSVTNDDMTKEEKLWAMFSYIADRNNYPYMQNRIPYYRGEDWPVVYAHDMMYLGGSYGHGYAALFGYAAVLCGYTDVHWAQNGFHAWVDIDGLVYDPVFRDSSYATEVYGWTYEVAISQNGFLGAGYEYPSGEGTYRFIRVPEF